MQLSLLNFIFHSFLCFSSNVVFSLLLLLLLLLLADKQLPTSPPGLPFFGNLHQIGAQPHRTLASLARRHGPVMLLRLVRVPVVVLSSAPKHVAFAKHGDVRRVCALHLLSLRRVRRFRAVKEEEVSLLVFGIRAAAGVPVRVSERITELTNDVVCQVAFGRKHFSELDGGNRVRHMFAELTKLLGAVFSRDLVAGDSDGQNV
ncbi:cytochrome P450 71A26-like [Curcuma longa]|uniref:cytochrome P450 71A26-like n=1 Tax=Curcuma longa TaxID=136217 RepID=UPI003D9DB8B4